MIDFDDLKAVNQRCRSEWRITSTKNADLGWYFDRNELSCAQSVSVSSVLRFRGGLDSRYWALNLMFKSRALFLAMSSYGRFLKLSGRLKVLGTSSDCRFNVSLFLRCADNFFGLNFSVILALFR